MSKASVNVTIEFDDFNDFTCTPYTVPAVPGHDSVLSATKHVLTTALKEFIISRSHPKYDFSHLHNLTKLEDKKKYIQAQVELATILIDNLQVTYLIEISE